MCAYAEPFGYVSLSLQLIEYFDKRLGAKETECNGALAAKLRAYVFADALYCTTK